MKFRLGLGRDNQPDYKVLAQKAMDEYRYQPGLIRVEVEGTPATGIRFRFDGEASATRFMFLRGLFRHEKPEMSDLSIDGSDVLEIWSSD
ncbi:MAG: hypothetical protein HGB01_06640 [Chlorobiaceae bacterium]|nr:hypothetical protein [Chlorobiaceae bacterium]